MAKSDVSQSLAHRIANLLFIYRNTPHTVTGHTPAQLFLNRAPRTRLSMLKPHLEERVEQRQEPEVTRSQTRHFKESDPVMVRDIRRDRWTPGVVTKVLGPRSYVVDSEDNPSKHVHVDHMRPRPSPPATESSEVSESVPHPVDLTSSQPVSTEPSIVEPVPSEPLRRSSRSPKPVVPLDL